MSSKNGPESEVTRPQYKPQRPELMGSLPTRVTLKFQLDGVESNIDSWKSANQLTDGNSVAGTELNKELLNNIFV